MLFQLLTKMRVLEMSVLLLVPLLTVAAADDLQETQVQNVVVEAPLDVTIDLQDLLPDYYYDIEEEIPEEYLVSTESASIRETEEEIGDPGEHEELPEPEAYHRKRPRLPPPRYVLTRVPVYVENRRQETGQISKQRNTQKNTMRNTQRNTLKDTLNANDFYKSALDSIQFEKNSKGASDETLGTTQSYEQSYSSSSSYEYDDEPLITEESWRLMSAFMPGKRRRQQNNRLRGRPFTRIRGRGRGRNRPREVLGKLRTTVGRQNFRRPATLLPFRPRSQLPTVSYQPQFRDPGNNRQHPRHPLFRVTDPTTTTPDTLSVHNIAGPPYYDTIPPDVLFGDDEVTTPESFFGDATTPAENIDEFWRPVAPTLERERPQRPTSKTNFNNYLSTRYPSKTETDRTDKPYNWDSEEDDNWRNKNIRDNNLNWNVNTDEEWFNIWNQNWGDEWGHKREGQTTTPSSATSGNSVFTGNFADDQILEQILKNHRLSDRPAPTVRFPDSSTEVVRYLDSPIRPLRFPDSKEQMIKLSTTVRPRSEVSVTPKVEHVYPGISIIDDFQPLFPANSGKRTQRPSGGNRRMEVVSDSGVLQSPLMKRWRPYPPSLGGVMVSNKPSFGAKKSSDLLHYVRGPRPSQSSLQPVFVQRAPPRVWNPGRSGSIRRERPRG